MRKEAADSPGRNTGTANMTDDENMTAASRRQAREGHMFNERPTHPVRRFTLGVALAVLALTFVPSLAGQYPGQAPQAGVHQQVAGESVSAPVLAEPTAEGSVTRAPAAFSDALAAAPAGAQCSVEAHSCSAPAADNEAAMSSAETAVAYGSSQTLRSAGHHQRM